MIAESVVSRSKGIPDIFRSRYLPFKGRSDSSLTVQSLGHWRTDGRSLPSTQNGRRVFSPAGQCVISGWGPDIPLSDW